MLRFRRHDDEPDWWPPRDELGNVEDPLAPARGCVVGVLLSILVLVVIVALALVWGRP